MLLDGAPSPISACGGRRGWGRRMLRRRIPDQSGGRGLSLYLDRSVSCKHDNIPGIYCILRLCQAYLRERLNALSGCNRFFICCMRERIRIVFLIPLSICRISAASVAHSRKNVKGKKKIGKLLVEVCRFLVCVEKKILSLKI